MGNNETINLESINDRLPSIAFELFRDWMTKMGLSDQLIIKSESLLVDDLRHAIIGGIHTLLQKEYRPPRMFNWDVGFVLGFIEGNITRHWYHEYVMKNMDEYRILCGLASLRKYLLFDEITRIRLDKIYSITLRKESNIENMTEDVCSSNLENDFFNLIPNIPESSILKLIQRMWLDQIEIISNIEPDISLSISDHFDDGEIRRLIDDNIDNEK